MSYDNSKKLVDKNSLALYTKKLLKVLDDRFNTKMEVVSGAPTTVPSEIGDIRVDQNNKVLYVSVGTESPSDWMAISPPEDLEYATNKDIDDFLDKK